MENLILAGRTEVLRGRWKQRVAYLSNLCEWMTEERQRDGK